MANWRVAGWRCPEEKWNERFAELVAFQKRFDHCRVPKLWSENRLLAAWVQNQRRQFIRMMNAEPQRVARMDAIGFNWVGTRSKVRLG